VRHVLEPQAQRPELERRVGVELAQLERALDVLGLHAARFADAREGLPRPRRPDEQRARRVVRAGPAVDRDRLLARGVGQARGERHEVEEVIGVQVRDHHGVDVHVVDDRAQLAEDARPAVEQEPHAVMLDQIAAAGAARVLPRRRLAEHGQSHRATLPP
jgi:hypothetical protein